MYNLPSFSSSVFVSFLVSSSFSSLASILGPSDKYKNIVIIIRKKKEHKRCTVYLMFKVFFVKWCSRQQIQQPLKIVIFHFQSEGNIQIWAWWKSRRKPELSLHHCLKLPHAMMAIVRNLGNRRSGIKHVGSREINTARSWSSETNKNSLIFLSNDLYVAVFPSQGPYQLRSFYSHCLSDVSYNVDLK